MPAGHAYPDDEAIEHARRLQRDEGKDPRFACWFCGEASVALAPTHSGGDEDVPAHWLPVCQSHRDQWHSGIDAAERMPIIPRDGVALSKDQAESASDAIQEWLATDMSGQDNDLMVDARDAIRTGLLALNKLESEDPTPDDLSDTRYDRRYDGYGHD